MGEYTYLIALAAYILLLDLFVLALVWRDRRRGASRSPRDEAHPQAGKTPAAP